MRRLIATVLVLGVLAWAGWTFVIAPRRAARAPAGADSSTTGYRAVRLFFASPGEIQGLRGAVTAFRDKQQDQYAWRHEWLGLPLERRYSLAGVTLAGTTILFDRAVTQLLGHCR